MKKRAQSFRIQANNIYASCLLGSDAVEVIDLIEKDLLDAYSLGVSSAMNAVDKWLEIRAIPDKFNKNKMENK